MQTTPARAAGDGPSGARSHKPTEPRINLLLVAAEGPLQGMRGNRLASSMQEVKAHSHEAGATPNTLAQTVGSGPAGAVGENPRESEGQRKKSGGGGQAGIPRQS